MLLLVAHNSELLGRAVPAEITAINMQMPVANAEVHHRPRASREREREDGRTFNRVQGFFSFFQKSDKEDPVLKRLGNSRAENIETFLDLFFGIFEVFLRNCQKAL